MRYSQWALRALLVASIRSDLFLWRHRDAPHGGTSYDGRSFGYLVVLAEPSGSNLFSPISVLFSSSGMVSLSVAGVLATTTAESEAEGSGSGVQDVPPQSAQRFAFDAQVDKMLHIVVNSLYQHPEVFLRELISNASDALDKIRYLLLSEPDKYKGGSGSSDKEEEIPLEVKIEYDADQGTLTIRDTGVGMTKEEMVENLGTVARSGTTKFIEALKESGNADSSLSQIGQFGVGFYSAFLVADRVTVASRSPLSKEQHVWETRNGSSDFLVYPDPRGNTLRRGTEITLHLKEDHAKEYTDPSRLRELAHHYSEFVMYPISLRTTSTVEVDDDDDDEVVARDDQEKDEGEEKEDGDDKKKKGDDDDLAIEDEEASEDKSPKKKKTKEVTTHTWEVLNTNPAIWTRDKDEITDEEYQSFFQAITGDEYSKAERWVHFNAEGTINFKSILYLPVDVPSDYRYGNIDTVTNSMRLYVRKVLIGNDFNLLPKYLQFVRGMVDSDDLALNVNRETLQENKVLQVIRKKVVRKAIELMSTFAKESEGDDASEETKGKYLEWYKKFSPNIKIGVIEDEPNRSKLAKLLRYQTSKSGGKSISLTDYVSNMKDWQKDIYVLGGTSVEEIEKSPFLEAFKEKDVEVLYLTDPVDEYLIRHAPDFDSHKFVQISSDTVKFQDDDQDLLKRREKAYRDKFRPLTLWLHELFRGSFIRIQIATKRSLGSVPAIASTVEMHNSANFERILRAQAHQHGVSADSVSALKVLELNPRHPLILKLLAHAPPTPKKRKPKKDLKKENEGEKKGEDEEEKEDPPVEIDPEILDTAWLVHDMALLNGGFSVKDPVAHTRRLMKALQRNLNLESLDLEPEINPPVEEDAPPEVDLDDPAAGGGIGGLNMEDFPGLKTLNLEDLDLESGGGLNLDEL
jgi:heat shock protein beta